jgi:predicted DNA-binding protein YlxM (UPF0122 family)
MKKGEEDFWKNKTFDSLAEIGRKLKVSRQFVSSRCKRGMPVGNFRITRKTIHSVKQTKKEKIIETLQIARAIIDEDNLANTEEYPNINIIRDIDKCLQLLGEKISL